VATANIVSGLELAEWLGVSRQTVAELASAGVVVRVGRGKFELKKSVTAYCNKMRLQVTGRAGGEKAAAGAAAERCRLAKEQADKIAIANAKARGELVEASAVEAEWCGVLRALRAGLLVIPSRAAGRCPHLTPFDVAQIDAEVRAVLMSVGKSESLP
jgi:phage terminase Nu1 subunit (DNA packaging protein)